MIKWRKIKEVLIDFFFELLLFKDFIKEEIQLRNKLRKNRRINNNKN